MLKSILSLPKNLVKLLIRFYQKFLSPDHSFWHRIMPGRTCIHYPSCSEYTYEAVDRFGAVKGSLMGIARILRCNPWSKGGTDPLPNYFSLRRNDQKP